MSNFGIFSLLVVGRDMPHPFAGITDELPRSTERLTPIVLGPASRALESFGEKEAQTFSRNGRRLS